MSGPVNMSAPAGGAGGFSFQGDQVETIIGQWKKLLDDLSNDAEDAELIAAVKAPGKEFASGDFARLAVPSANAFLQQNKKMREYVQNYIEALESAKNSVQNKEDETKAAIGKQGEQS